MPKISVIMSTYNRAASFLRKAIDSVLGQTYGDFELWVVDDCSPDNTEEVVKSYAAKDPRVKYLRLDKNSGSDTKPKNLGIQKSSGQYLAYVDDDVELFPYHLELLVSKLEGNPEIDFVYSDMSIWYPDEPGKKDDPAIAMDYNGQFLMKRNYIDTSEVMHKRELAFAVGGFDESLPKFIDWNMWVRMAKWGARFQRVPVITVRYASHKKSKSQTVETQAYVDPATGMTFPVPTFDPVGCPVFLPNLGENIAEMQPRVAIFTLTYERLDYTKRMWKSLKSSTKYPFTWFVVDNGSRDGTVEWLKHLEQVEAGNIVVVYNEKNAGITGASNQALDMIRDVIGNPTQIIIKVDNDCEFMTKNWLEDLVELWMRNHRLYMSPYPEGLVSNPGGAPRTGVGYIDRFMVEITKHIGGLLSFSDARLYKDFRWSDQFLHGNQDSEISRYATAHGFMPCYISKHRIMHMDTTAGQQAKFPDYFERRKKEKTATKSEDVQ